MSSANEMSDIVAVELPPGTRAALEEVAAENFTTPQILLSGYIQYGIEQTKLARKFDMALGGPRTARQIEADSTSHDHRLF